MGAEVKSRNDVSRRGAQGAPSSSLWAFRQQRLALFCKQSGLVYAGIVIATIAEASLAQRWADVPLLCTYAVALCLPAVASHLRAGALIVPVYVLSNLLVSLCDLGIALGWLPFLRAIRAVYQARQEMLGELMCSLPGQLDIATMGVLHALRQGARGLIYVRCLGGDPWYSAQRWGLDWAVLMVLQCAYELRTRSVYRKTMQRQALDADADAAASVVLDDTLAAGSVGPRLASGPTDSAQAGAAEQPRTRFTANQRSTAAGGTPANGVHVTSRREITSARDRTAVNRASTAHLLVLPGGPRAHYKPVCPPLTVSLKITDIEPEELPIDFMPTLQLRTHAWPWQRAAWDLRDGAELTAQAPSELAGYAWDDSAHAFVQSQSVQAQLTALLQLAALCRLVSAGPVVQCLAAAAGSRSHKVQLQLQLTVPSRSRLVGWQPAGSAVSAEAEALTLTSDVPQLDVLVLVRRPSGTYLPVTLSLLADNQTPTAGSETWTVNVQAEADVPCKEATGLSVEMWAKVPGDSPEPSSIAPELRVAHSPVLLFTAQQQAAAAELTELVQSMGGVSGIPSLPLHTYRGTMAPDEPDATGFVNDLHTWLSYMSTDNEEDSQSDGPLGDSIAQTGRCLLSHAVLYGACELAQLLVTAMGQSSGVSTSAGELGAAWFLAAAKPAVAAEGAAAVSPLLHAAMASGNADMLEKVLRWGQVYGGRQWRWPWSLTDGSGYTALHLAAAQPQASACVALLETVKRMLPGQIPAAHTAWLHEQGRVRATPSQMFATRHPQHASDSLWEQHSSDSGKPVVSSVLRARAGGSSSAKPANAPATTRAQGASGTAVEPATDAPTDNEPLPSFRGLMREAWRWRQPPEYEAWALRQLSPVVHTWAYALLFVALAVIIRSCVSHCVTVELTYVAIHHLAYVLIAATSLPSIARHLGTWQDYMPLVPFGHLVAYIYMGYLRPALPAWSMVSLGAADCVYTLFVVAVGEQNSLPFMAMTRPFLAVAHGYAFDAFGIPHPYALCIAMHAVAVCMCTVIRTYQLRAFHRWLRNSARKKDVSATAASSSGQASTEGPEQQQQRGKAKVQ